MSVPHKEWQREATMYPVDYSNDFAKRVCRMRRAYVLLQPDASEAGYGRFYVQTQEALRVFPVAIAVAGKAYIAKKRRPGSPA